MFKEDPKDIQEFIRNEADEELLRNIEFAERSNNMKQYKRLQTQLLKDYNNYLKEQSRND